jgi:hypothetical protein
MKLDRAIKERNGSATITSVLCLTLALSGVLVLTGYAADPAWWSSRGAIQPEQVVTNNGVVTTNYAPNPNAIANAGQLKAFTVAAVNELNSDLPNSATAAPALSNLVYGWQQDYATNNYNNAKNPLAPYKPTDFAPVNEGQLKYVAKLIDNQLVTQGYLAALPTWLQGTNATDHDAALIGQLKTVFNFDLTVPKVPTNVTATEQGSQATVTWSNPTAVTGSIIQISSDKGVTWTTATIISGTATTGNVTGLEPGLAYSFRVISSNANGASSPSLSTAPSLSATPPAWGLQLWLKADTGTTLDANGGVSQWADQGSNQYLATQSSSSNRPVLVTDPGTGEPALYFSGNQWIGGSDLIAANQDLTIITAASDSTPSYPNYDSVVALGANPGGGAMRGYSYQNGEAQFDIYQNVVNAGVAPDTAQGAVATLTFSRSTGAVAFYLQGAPNGTGNISVNDLASGYVIGQAGWSGADWNGNIYEVLVYNRVLSPSEQQQAEIYLADKYGLYNSNATWPLAYSSDIQALITANQWNKSQADAYQALSNTPGLVTNGLVIWLGASAGVATDGNGHVTQWTDQASGKVLNQLNTANAPSLVASDLNGQPALRFNGNAWLRNPDSLGAKVNSDMTMIAVASTSSPTAQQYAFWMGAVGNGTNRGIGYDATQELMDTYNIFALGRTAPNPNIFVAEAWTLGSDLATTTLYQNGAQVGGGRLTGVQGVQAGLSVGTINGQGSNWQGDIAEILVYDHQLSAADFQAVSLYLANKYNLYNPGATWLSGSKYVSIRSEIDRNQWNQPQADAYLALQNNKSGVVTQGLALWLKADSGVGLDGNGHVTNWSDQAGQNVLTAETNGNPLTATADDINGYPALHFDGNQWLHSPNSLGVGLNTDMTMIAVTSTSNPEAQQYAFWMGAIGNGLSRGIGYDASQELMDTYNSYALGGAAPQANLFASEVWTLSSDLTTTTLYQNGTQVGTAPLAGVRSVQSGLSVGTLYGQGNNWQGDIAEILVYDHQLSPAALQTVGVYLADKYGLYNPNATWPMAYSTDVQNQITLYHWNKSQADAYVNSMGSGS